MSLKPCPYRHVGDEGHILCDKIKIGDREVSPNICRACPIAQINCAHLRAVLEHQAHPPVIVRWGNGKTEIWEDDAPSIAMQRAACAEKVIPIHSPRDCAGCALRQPLVLADSIAPAEHPRPSSVAASEPKRKSNRSRTMPQPATPPIMPVQATQPLAQIEPPASIPPNPPPRPEPPTQLPIADKRSTVVAQKIIQLQEWLAKNVAQKKQAEAADQVKPIEEPRPRAVGEEKRVGWTD